MCQMKPETVIKASQSSDELRAAIEEELEAEARAADRSPDLDGSLMFTDGGPGKPLETLTQ